MLQIFVLQLENDKWFLHIADDSTRNTVFFECQSMFDFVKTNPPILIYETIPMKDQYEIHRATKTYMEYFGIDNVRGGMYTDVVLPDYLIKSIVAEIAFSTEKYTEPFTIFDTLRNFPESTLEDFIKRSNSYTELKNMGYKEITMEFCGELEWLEGRIQDSTITDENKVGNRCKIEDDTRYKQLLEKMATLRDKYYQLEEDKITVESTALIKNPKFIFDFFIYHQHWCNDMTKQISIAMDILKKYEFMAYTLMNILDTMEFSFYNSI